MTEVLPAVLRRQLAHANETAIVETLDNIHPHDVARALDELALEELVTVLQPLPERRRARIFGYLRPEVQVAIANTFGRNDRDNLISIMTHMSHDERADVFNRLTDEQQRALLPGLAQAERDDIRALASHPQGSAGSIMTSDYATLTPDLTVREAIDQLRLEAPDKETIYSAYVLDDARHLIGVVSLRDLILAPEKARVGEIMQDKVIFATVDTPSDEAAQKVSRYDLLALPVVDASKQLVGIITQDDAMDVQEHEAARDLHMTASVSDVVSDVGRASIWTLYRLRILWLMLLVFANIFSGAGIAAFEDTVEAYVALVFFLPLLIDSGGNAGSQAATLMVRGLATREVRMADWGRMISREVFIAGLLGLSMAVAVSLLGVVRGGPEIAVVVAASMVVIVLVGSTIGVSLPFVLSRFKVDPATASAPLVTSIADATGVVIYFAIASSFLPVVS